MTRPYLILYRGRLAGKTLTAVGAAKAVNELMATKGWTRKDLEIRKERGE